MTAAATDLAAAMALERPLALQEATLDLVMAAMVAMGGTAVVATAGAPVEAEAEMAVEGPAPTPRAAS
jgi:hypothetical protein